MNHLTRLLLSLSLAILASCDNDDSVNTMTPTPAPAPAPAPVMQDYQIEVVNLTFGQPFSPIALVAHDSSYRTFSIGDVASAGLELLAEGGDNTDFLTEASMEAGVSLTMSAAGVLPPGSTEVFALSIEETDVPGMLLSAVTMLVNTNDALTAAHALSIEGLAAGESMTVTTISYDAGTEANSEESGTIPGPIDGGEGFNTVRDDVVDEIRGHGGVVTADDGLQTSVLGESNRWDNPVARVTITRML